MLEERVNLDSRKSPKLSSSNGRGKLNRAHRQASDHKLVLDRWRSAPMGSLRKAQFLQRGFSVDETCLPQGPDLWKFMDDSVLASIAKTAEASTLPQHAATVLTA